MQLSGYTLIELIHESVNSLIYRGIRNKDKCKVILKILKSPYPPERLAQFQREFHLQKGLNGAGTPHVYDFETIDNNVAIILADDDLITLKEYLKKNGTILDLKNFLTTAIRLVENIKMIHDQHIIHKDINPTNILWDEKNQKSKLIDFGISSVLFIENLETPNIKKIEGTLNYISPEQTGRMNRSIDSRTDLYSLGVTFYEMLTGHLPFQEQDILKLVHSHLAVTPEPVASLNPDIPIVISNIIAKLLAKTPEDRYASAFGLIQDLLKCQKMLEENTEIKSFILGKNDIHDQLIFSQKLYGREEEIEKLLSIFTEVSNGANALLFVAGHAGIGKTALVKEIYKPVTKQSGYFISGKYDQLQRSKPYSAIIDALKTFIHSLLSESENELSSWKEKFLHALENNGQIIIDAIPEMALIIGQQPILSELSPSGEQNRFLNTFLNFIGVIAQKQHPLVIFLDDLQWVDNASLKLIHTLITGTSLQYFLLIGAYRINEVDSNHPLTFMKEQLKKEKNNLYTLVVNPLNVRDVHLLLADTLNMSPKSIEELANLILSKTQGNPFFIGEFLRKLREDNLLYFSYEKRQWEWSIEKIQQRSITDNVIDLLISRFNTLPEDAKEILIYAACIGYQFDIETLHVISQKSLKNISKSLMLAIQQAFIMPIDKNYQIIELLSEESYLGLENKIRFQFQHDRIQQAVAQSMSEKKRQVIHLQIGYTLLKNRLPTEHEEQLFELMDHFNNAIDLIKDGPKKMELAKYNLWAGKLAKSAAAFDAAKNYFQSGLHLLSELTVSKKQDLFLELSKELATSLYAIGELDKAEHAYITLLKETTDIKSSIAIYKLYCQMLSTQLRHNEALIVGCKALALLNIHIPMKPSKLRIIAHIIKIQSYIWRKPLNDQMLPLMKSETSRLASDMIGQLMISAFANQDLFALLACTNVYLSLTEGYTKNTTAAGLSYCIILLRLFKSPAKIMKLVEYFCELESHYGMAFSKGRVLSLLAVTIDIWRFPLDKCFDEVCQAYQNSIEEGDFFVSTITSIMIVLYAFMIGKPVVELQVYAKNIYNFISKYKLQEFTIFFDYFKMVLENLTDGSRDFQAELLNKKLAILQAHTLATKPLATAIFFFEAVKFCYLLGYYEEARQWSLEALKYKKFGNGISNVTLYFYSGLALLSDSNISKYKKILNEIHRELKQIAAWSPDNFNFYLFLFEAELARHNDTNPKKAMQLYNSAIQIAKKQNMLPNLGIANECASKFYLQLNIPELAKNYYLNSYRSYQYWGATTILMRLEKAQPDWVRNVNSAPITEKTSVSIDSSISSLDMLSLLRATQAISSEIQLDSLLKKLIMVLLENAGAQRGVLIVKDDNSWHIAVEGTIEQQKVMLTKENDIEQCTNLPMTLIRLVQRTQETVTAQNQYDFEPYAEDPYIAKVKPQSIIIIPIRYQGQLKNILFLENRTTSNTFTPERVHILNMLSSQAVISLINARLYYQATHDPLTGLANRNLLYQMFPLAVGRANRNHTSIAILFLDLDGFKNINDTLGHEVGDKLLLRFSDHLKSCLREGDLAVRLGGDEFVALLEDIDRVKTSHIAELILQQSKPIVIQENTIFISASIGISCYPENAENIDTLLKQADTALYYVKGTGKCNYQFYSQTLDQQLMQEKQLEKELHGAESRGELRIYYQPVYSAHKHQIIHFEALLRWQHPSLGLLESKDFIHLAENNDLILTLGAWVFYTVFHQLKSWQQAGLNIIPVAINVSALQFRKEMLSKFLPKALSELNLDPHFIELEFTESIFIDYDERIASDIKSLKKLGFTLTLDDFGTRYSSLSYLSRFPVDHIKIDQSFIAKIEKNKKDCHLISNIIKMAHSLNLVVIAEGVETENQVIFLENNGIDELQGYYFSRPVSQENAKNILEKMDYNNQYHLTLEGKL